jgi:hypothetical protein
MGEEFRAHGDPWSLFGLSLPKEQPVCSERTLVPPEGSSHLFLRLGTVKSALRDLFATQSSLDFSPGADSPGVLRD